VPTAAFPPVTMDELRTPPPPPPMRVTVMVVMPAGTVQTWGPPAAVYTVPLTQGAAQAAGARHAAQAARRRAFNMPLRSSGQGAIHLC
jgi:hypothetical protein